MTCGKVLVSILRPAFGGFVCKKDVPTDRDVFDIRRDAL